MTFIPNPSAPHLERGKNGTRHVNMGFAALAGRSSFTTAALPVPAQFAGAIVFVTDGAAGQPCLAFSDGNAWHRIVIGAAPSVTA